MSELGHRACSIIQGGSKSGIQALHCLLPTPGAPHPHLPPLMGFWGVEPHLPWRPPLPLAAWGQG